jgi:transcriptional regulator with XRE-family HTH domain
MPTQENNWSNFWHRLRTFKTSTDEKDILFAERLGVARGLISNWSNQINPEPTLGTLRIIRGKLNLSSEQVDWLLFGEGPPPEVLVNEQRERRHVPRHKLKITFIIAIKDDSQPSYPTRGKRGGRHVSREEEEPTG